MKTAEMIEMLKSHEATIESLKTQLEELKATINEKSSTVRDRGPQSTREMTEEDARQIMLGELKGLSHKAAAEKLGLSYGQIYSARNGYTFKGVYAEMKKAE